MEEHEGITLLATNRQRDLDEAFVRRFHVIVDFPLPLEPERLKIWQGMIPATARTEALDLPALARDYEASGGEIKNAALAAAFLAAASGGVMTMAHLRQAVRRELLKSGKTVDEAAP
jgi:SpoVK/Ycf46/Vps4 family AAA+-type ATPase